MEIERMIAPLSRNLGPPRWIIDDTSKIEEARVYVAHTHSPRFFAEILPPDDEDLNVGFIGMQLSNGEWLSYIQWIDEPCVNVVEMIQSLEEALAHHWTIRDG
jgi:hypothetical protein